MLAATLSRADDSMAVAADKNFYRRLGQRIAQHRKEQGITQVQLAETLGIAQQTMAHYEAGSVRVAIAMLPTLAKALHTSIEELMGTQPAPKAAGKRGPAPKIQKQLEQIETLPMVKQRAIAQLLDSVLAANQ